MPLRDHGGAQQAWRRRGARRARGTARCGLRRGGGALPRARRRARGGDGQNDVIVLERAVRRRAGLLHNDVRRRGRVHGARRGERAVGEERVREERGKGDALIGVFLQQPLQ